jgi:hypothetical protein
MKLLWFLECREVVSWFQMGSNFKFEESWGEHVKIEGR